MINWEPLRTEWMDHYGQQQFRRWTKNESVAVLSVLARERSQKQPNQAPIHNCAKEHLSPCVTWSTSQFCAHLGAGSLSTNTWTQRATRFQTIENNCISPSNKHRARVLQDGNRARKTIKHNNNNKSNQPPTSTSTTNKSNVNDIQTLLYQYTGQEPCANKQGVRQCP